MLHEQCNILIDSHVHIQTCFSLDTFFNSALINFKRARLGNGPFVLMLTETVSTRYFPLLAQELGNRCVQNQSTSPWRVKQTAEKQSLYIDSGDGEGIFIIVGHQLVTREGIEVLALMTPESPGEGHSLLATVQAIGAGGGIPVLPWGFGKWMGRRGEILQNFLDEGNFSILFMGDNSGRPNFWPEPYFFKKAKDMGLTVLPGTDPLPFASEVDRAGCFGCSVQGLFDPEKPAQSLKRILLQLPAQPQTYGTLETPYRFVRHQVAMQFVKHWGARA